MLGAEVETVAREHILYHVFVIVVPALENYRYSLFKIHHRIIELYPVFVDNGPILPDEQIQEHQQIYGEWLHPGSQIPLKDEAKLRDWLRYALSADSTKRVLENLLAQVSG
jgi:hypothetical protein